MGPPLPLLFGPGLPTATNTPAHAAAEPLGTTSSPAARQLLPEAACLPAAVPEVPPEAGELADRLWGLQRSTQNAALASARDSTPPAVGAGWGAGAARPSGAGGTAGPEGAPAAGALYGTPTAVAGPDLLGSGARLAPLGSSNSPPGRTAGPLLGQLGRSPFGSIPGEEVGYWT